MRPRTSFFLRTLAISVVLAAVWWSVTITYTDWWVIGNAGFSVPVFAAILASTMDWRSKGRALGALAAVFLLGDVIAEVSGARAIAGGAPGGDSAAGSVVAALYHVFRMGVPIATLLVVAGGNVSSLWTVPSRPKSDVCPVCGRRRSGLEAHVRDAHGDEVLRSLKAKRRI